MKKVIIVISVVFMMSAWSTLSANVSTESPTSIYVSKSSEAKKIVLNLDHMFADKVTCQILNEFGIVIFTSEINTSEQVSKKYDLSELPTGEYTIIVKDLMKIEKIGLEITVNDVNFNSQESEITFKPTVWLNNDNNTVDFNLLALGDVATLRIMSAEGEVFSKKYRGQKSISKRFDLSHVAAGDYKVIVFHKGETFVHKLAIK